MSFDFACLAIGVYYTVKTFVLLRKYDNDTKNISIIEKESKELISDINQAVTPITPETPDFPADDSRGRCVDDTPSNEASSDSDSVLVDDINQTDLRTTITPLKLTPYNYLSSVPTGWYKGLESPLVKDPFASVGNNRCQSKLIFDFSDWEATGKSRCITLFIDGMGTYKLGEHVDLGKYSILDTTFTHKWIKNVYEYLDTDTKNAMIFIECIDEPDINVPPHMREKYIFYVNVSPDKEAYIEKIPLTDGRFYVYKTNNGYYICDRNNLKSTKEIENYTCLHTY